jgi:ABC-type phosphate/phosphonate transport system substrate-binding protein
MGSVVGENGQEKMRNLGELKYGVPMTGASCGSKRYNWTGHRALPITVKTFIALLLCVSICLQPISCIADDMDDLPKVLRSGFPSKIIADVDPRDAQATLELLTTQISRNIGLNTTSKVMLYPDVKSIIEAVRRDELELISIPSIDYLRLRDRSFLIPAFVPLHTDGTGIRFALITRNDSGIRSVSDLKGKTVLGISANKMEIGHVWLEQLLLKEGKESPALFFRHFKETNKYSQAIMGVFFRQADAALVTKAAMDSAKMLNPQVDRQLRVIAESRELSDGVTCFPAKLSEKMRRNLMIGIMKINDNPSGKQLLTILQSSGIAPFKPSHLSGLEELLKEQSLLKARLAKKR